MAFPRIEVGLVREERLPAILLIIFLAALCAAGGASRESVLSQGVIRGVAVTLMLVQTIFGNLPVWSRYKGPALLLASMAALAALQLVPLPPVIWTALPGRSVIASSPLGAQGWRPLNLVPGAGWNALFSLLVPLCVIFLLSSLRTTTAWRGQYFLIAAAIFSALLALLQAAGSAPENPLINGSTTDYAGIFANRNHQALFLAIGIMLSWFWGIGSGRTWRDRRAWVAVCVIVLLFMSILVTGSRSGALLAGAAVVVGSISAQVRPTRGARRRFSTMIVPGIALVVMVGVVVISTYFGRAFSLNRAVDLNLDSDFRLRSVSTVWEVVKTYFPFGAGLGSFDNVFRIAEPISLLEPTYFNHAHDDFLEMLIETGIFGPIIFLCAMAWALRRIYLGSSDDRDKTRVTRMGALIFVLVTAASLSDYPARTPMIMAALMIAACWLDGSTRMKVSCASEALPVPANTL